MNRTHTAAAAAILTAGVVFAPTAAQAAPIPPPIGRPCAPVNFERHWFGYRYYHLQLDRPTYCFYRVEDDFFMGGHGKLRDLPLYVVNKHP